MDKEVLEEKNVTKTLEEVTIFWIANNIPFLLQIDILGDFCEKLLT